MSITKNSRGLRRRRPKDVDLAALLKPTATTSERVRGLLAVGLHPSDIAKTVGVSTSALRNWSAGQAEPRPDSAITLDDLRATTKLLLDGGLEPARAVKWLTSRNSEQPANKRPLDLLPTSPMEVLAAAHDEVLEAQISATRDGKEPIELMPAGR